MSGGNSTSTRLKGGADNSGKNNSSSTSIGSSGARSRMQRACEMVGALLRPERLQQNCPYHVLNVQILSLLQQEGLIRGFSVNGGKINILLKHYQGAPVIRNVRVVSKPSRAIWLTVSDLKHKTRFNSGLWVMQTACGVISHRDCLRLGIGGKVLMAVNNGYQHFC